MAEPRSARAIFCRGIQRPLWVLIVMFGILNLLALLAKNFKAHLQDLELITYPSKQSPYSNWSTHGVTPVRCHSHNDHWRHVPLHSALSAGCISVEVDIWPWRDEILVGHSKHTVLRGSLKSLYLDPLVTMLDMHNHPSSSEVPDGENMDDNKDGNKVDIFGVFANDPTQTLVLLVDSKADGDALWPLLLEALAPLRERGYLTHFNESAGGVSMRPITVVASGNISFSDVLSSATYRDVFFDAPLDHLTQFTVDETVNRTTTVHNDPNARLLGSPFNPNNSYYASVDFRKAIGSLQLGRFSDTQLQTLRGQVQAAHELGLKVRYWGNPSWPIGLRNLVWDFLLSEDVDVISTDDLKGATRQVWWHSSWWSW
ncbi:uncharacterized protein N7511_002933 [Penicillium nucicola]|uniref:uncharacterized protein n=1 Tax=Penicillium nucicola TaxID=1850975 RepID=UPI0025458A88|nr:uncharacterized protein N7511_002933 [Penicillium nucicola]KAJ5770882.1 hypothetical protein N7511_002933 [Penicillium nucicola]